MSGRIVSSDFSPSWWLSGPHAQTLFPNTLRRAPRPVVRWEVFELADGDFVELAWSGPADGPLAFVLHGLGGNWESPPLRGVTAALVRAGWQVCCFHFRGCARSPNRSVTAYHSGMTADPLEVLQALAHRFPDRTRVAVGFSLGGNVLLRLLGEQQDRAPIDAAVAVSVPFQLARCAERMDSGASRLYQTVLLRRLQQYLRARRALGGPTGPVEPALLARNFRAFDDVFTAPVHGYAGADDYYERASCRPILRHIQRPTLVIHSIDDPFMHPDIVPEVKELSSHVTVELTQGGGHVGFVDGPIWRPRYWLDHRIPAWLDDQRTAIQRRVDATGRDSVDTPAFPPG
ncbi:MAG: hydrolase [Deltaproteobacteria bacterium]|nr:hydrolase [Deltaproteobacteria bacterium]HCH66091.1 hydrolase [Deltaproteobacteria bacterium]